jgi:hypothetical protein
MGFATGSRGEVPGKRKPVIREQQHNVEDDDADDDRNTVYKINLRNLVLLMLKLH